MDVREAERRGVREGGRAEEMLGKRRSEGVEFPGVSLRTKW